MKILFPTPKYVIWFLQIYHRHIDSPIKQYIQASSARKQLPQNSCEWQNEDDLHKHLPSTAKLFCEGGKITTNIDDNNCSKVIIIII